MSWHERYIPDTQGEWRPMDSEGATVMQMETALVPVQDYDISRRDYFILKPPKVCEYCGQRYPPNEKTGMWQYQRSKFCSISCFRAERGMDGGVPKAAICQALSVVFNKSQKEIRQIMGMSKMAVCRFVTISENSPYLPWWKRKYKAEAIEAARRLLCK